MTATTITDLPLSRALDYKAMSSIKGAGGAPWVFGAFQPFVRESARFAPIVNFFQTNNTFVADQLNVQFQTILWKDLRLIFPRCPKPQRQRHTVSSALNQIRELRNRVFHHEQLL